MLVHIITAVAAADIVCWDYHPTNNLHEDNDDDADENLCCYVLL